MNLPAANSGGSAGPIPTPPPITVEVWLPDGSCIPATPETLKIVLKQARSDALKKRKAARKEKAEELQRSLEDRAAARRLLQEIAEIDRDRRRVAATLRAVVVKDDKPTRQTSNVQKRAVDCSRPVVTPTTMSSWVIDDFGQRGVHYAQSYIGRKSPGFYRGAARDRWTYDARDEAVVRDRDGNPITICNFGDDFDEISAGWQCIEDATTRKNGKIQIRIVVALDADAGTAEHKLAVQTFCENVLGSLGLPYSAVIHRPSAHGDQRNVHAHILTNLRPTRRVAPYCWEFCDEILGELDGRNGVQMLRHLWAHSMSEAAEKAQRNMRYTGLGYAARGLDLETGEHLGEAKSEMVARGQTVWAWERNRIKNARNAMRRAVRDADRKIAALTKIRDAALARMIDDQEKPRATVMRAAAFRPRAAPVLRSSRPMTNVAERLAPAVRTPMADRSENRRSPSSRGEAASSRLKPSGESITPLRGNRRMIAGADDVPAKMALVSTQAMPIARSADDRHLAASVPKAAPEMRLEIGRSAPSGTSRHALTTARLDTGAQMLADPLQWFRTDTASVISLEPASLPTNVRPAKKGRLARSDIPRSTPPILAEIETLLLVLRQQRSRRAGADKQDSKERAASNGIAVPISIGQQGRSSQASQSDRPERRSDPAMPAREPAEVGEDAQPQSTAPTAGAPLHVSRSRRWRMGARTRWSGTRATAAHELPERVWFEANPMVSWPAEGQLSREDESRLERLRKIDAYVVDFGEGRPEIDYSALKAIGADQAWSRRPSIQAALQAIRSDQQQVIADLAGEAERRPLEFAKAGTQFWPRDCRPEHLARLDRWARDPGFQHDMFAIEQAVRGAHERRDIERRAAVAARTAIPSVEPLRKLAWPIPDGFGGMRETLPPPFEYKPVGPQALAFDGTSAAPTKPLLMLLHFCGERPRDIVFADDGLLMGADGIPKSIDALVRSWRHDARVQAVVVETVRASRQAGRPTYPPEHAAAIKALTPGASSDTRSPNSDKGLSR